MSINAIAPSLKINFNKGNWKKKWMRKEDIEDEMEDDEKYEEKTISSQWHLKSTHNTQNLKVVAGLCMIKMEM